MDRVGSPIAEPSSSTVLGDWYANVSFWRPQVALFVNAATFVPVLVPFAPASGVVARFPMAMAEVLAALGVDPRFVDTELTEMSSVVLAKTASRQVLGVMNEFTFMAERTIGTGRSDPADLLGLSVWLANTIVGPISKDNGYTPIGVLQRVVSAALPDHWRSAAGSQAQGPADTRRRVTCGLSDPRSQPVLRPEA